MIDRQVSLLLILVAVVVVNTGCSSLGRLEKALFKDSALHNLNPAPSTMSPPSGEGAAQVIDPTYNQTQADYHFTVAESLSLEGQTQKAIEAFKLTLIYDPISSLVRLRLAAEYIRQGLISEAIEQAELATQQDPSSYEGRLLLAGLYSTIRMHDLALKQYNYLSIQYPEDMDIPLYKGALFAEQKRFKEAEEVFLSLAKHPQNKKPAKAYYYLGRVQAQQNGIENYKRAEQTFLKAIASEPEGVEYVMALAKLYEKMEMPKSAFTLLASYQDKFGPKKVVARTLSTIYLENEDYPKALRELENLENFEPDNLNVKVKIALIYIEQKQYEEAISKLEEIIRVAPESDKIRFYLGAVYEEVKNFKSALYHFSYISTVSPYYSEAIVHVAYLHKLLGEMDKAVQTIEKAIAEKQDVPQFYTFYASLLDETRDYEKAIKMLKSAVEKFPEHAQLRFFLGSMWDRKGDKTASVFHMQKVLDIDENHAQALNFLAYTLAEEGQNLDEAERLAFRALDGNPDDGYILDTVGWVKYKKGQYEEAIKYLEAAHKLADKESIIAEHLGDAYFRYELIDKAKKMYLKAVSIAEDASRVKEIRTKITNIDRQMDLRRPASER